MNGDLKSTWINEIPEEKIPEPYRTIFIEFGPEVMLRFSELFQGMGMYFPKLDSLLREIRDKKIQYEFIEGLTYKELARKYNLTETMIRNIVGQKYDENQLRLFDNAL